MEHEQRPLFALALRVGSAFVFATLYFIIKFAGERGISVPEIMFWRQAGCLPVIVTWMLLTHQLHAVRTRRITTHARRAMLGMTSMAINFTATVMLPLTVSTTLGFAMPIFAVLIAAFFFRDKVGRWRWSAVLLGFAGVAIVVQPGPEYVNPIGVALMLTGALIIAVINFQIRDLSRTESSAGIVFWFTVFGTLLMTPLMPFYMQAYTPLEWLLVISMGITGAIGQLLMTASLRHGAVASVIVMDYTQLIWATVFGWLAWNKLPNASLYLGAPLIIAAGAIIAFREQILARLRNREIAVRQVAE